MAELNTIKNRKYPKRVAFPKGKQEKFLKVIQNKLGLSLKDFAKLSGVHKRTMSDWKREKLLMSLVALNRMCRRAKISLPKNIEIKSPFWYTKKGAKIGWLAVYKKYGRIGGDPEYRKRKWHEWWEKEGRFRKHSVIGAYAPLKIPRRSSQLAEFVGILLGDGGITKGQITISFHIIDDRIFASYVRGLAQNLFDVNPSLSERQKKGIIRMRISRKKLVGFFNKMGLSSGNKVKNQIDVPTWIKNSTRFTKLCLRGLFDTDGCFYIDKHRYKDRVYRNCAMNFTNRSLPILSFFQTKLEQFGFHPTHSTKFSVLLRRESEIVRYFQEIGSSNPKHLNKFKKYFKDKYGEVPKLARPARFRKPMVV